MTSAGPASTEPTTILLVDDSAYWADTIGDGLRKEGYAVSVMHDGLLAVDRLRHSPPQILITDYFLANLDGGKLCQIAKRVPVDPPICTIILTAGADQSLSRPPSKHADAVIAKNTTDIVLGDLCRTLAELRLGKLRADPSRAVIGHQRLQPRAVAGKLHGLKQYLDALHEGMGDAVIGVDSELRIYFVNSTAAEIFDLEEQETLARPIDEVLGIGKSHALVALVRSAISDGGKRRPPVTLEINSSTLRASVAGLRSPDGRATALVIARDITDLKIAEQARLAVEARLHEADKMASLGHLVAGVSHEINNPLAAILLNLSDLAQGIPRVQTWFETAMRGEVPAGLSALNDTLEEMARIVRDSEEAANRIRAVVADMRLFAHPNSSGGERGTVEELLDKALSIIGSEVRHKATLIRSYSETPPLVVDSARLSQAFLNVLLNAAQAIEGSAPEDNWIEVKTRVKDDGVVVEISNSGPSIPEELLPKVFDPFFTTKQVGQGVGLGLSITYETLRRHGGYIEVRSGEDAPTTFSIWLPFDTGLVLGTRAAMPERTSHASASVLIVDDDKLVRNSLRRVLERYYDVSVAPSAHRASELLAEKWYDVVVCDLIMPGCSGMEFFQNVRQSSPAQAARFVFLTGGTNNPEARDFLTQVDNPRAYKPVSAEEVVAFVERCIREFSSAA